MSGDLVDGIQSISLGGTPNVKSKSKKRGLHAFHDFTSQNSIHGNDPNIDPNEAAIGLYPPQFSSSMSSLNTPTLPFNNQFQSPASVINGSPFSHQIPNQFVQQSPSVSSIHSPFVNNVASFNDQPSNLNNNIINNNTLNNNTITSEAYNINEVSVVDDLSISNKRNIMNEIYENQEFLSFEHVLPPFAGTEYKSIDQGNVVPQFGRVSMYSIPFSEELREKTKIPLGIVLRPFADFQSNIESNTESMNIKQVKIEEGSTVPRCRRCRAYLNPAMQYTDNNMICNICGFSSPLPNEYISTIGMNGIRDDYHVRPELNTAVIDYVVPKEYNLNENIESNNPLHRIFLLDLSHSSYHLKVVETVCSAIRISLFNDDGSSKLPPGAKISIIGFDNKIHFFNLSPDLQKTTVSLVTDLEDPFIPFNDGTFVDPNESFNIIDSTLTAIETNDSYKAPEPAFGAALKAAQLLLKEVGGGQIISVLSTIPSLGPGNLMVKTSNGKLENDYIKETFTFDNKFYSDLSNEFVKDNIGVNLLIATQSNVDLINLASFATNTGGTVKEWLPFNYETDEISLIFEINKVIENIAGYQCQLKVRCSHGLQVKNYYGPFKTITGDLAPNIPIVSSDSSIVCDFTYDSKLNTTKDAHFQAAFLYTSKDGSRKVRVINMILSVSQRISDVFNFIDQDSVVKILLKRINENFKNTTMVALKNSLMMQVSDILAAYKHYIAGNQNLLNQTNQFILPECLKTLPMVILSILKTKAFKSKIQYSDLRVSSLFKLSQYNLTKLSVYLYPVLYCIHSLDEEDFIPNEQTGLIRVGKSLSLTVNNLEFGGAYLIYNGEKMMIWVHSDVNPLLLQDLFGSHIENIQDLSNDTVSSLPILDTHISVQVRNMVEYLTKHFNNTKKQNIEIVRFRIDSNEREFQQMFVEDKSDDLIWSYSDFLKEMHKHVDTKFKSLSSDASSGKAADNDGENISRRFGIF